jgi:hypothetical protein
MAKEYKNVYTILEKVKKGEIDTYYKDKDGLFGRINFYKKPDLVKPHLHYIDENRLYNIVDAHLTNTNTIMYHLQKFSTQGEFKDLASKPAAEEFAKKFKETYEDFPEHIANDIFKMYYNKIEKLDFVDRVAENYTKYKFLEKSNNPVGKVMTEKSNLKSAIFTRNIISYFIARLTMLKYVNPKAAEDLENSMNNGDDFDNQGIDKTLDEMLNSGTGKSMLESAMQEAQNLCKQMDGAMPDDAQEKLFESCGESKGGEANAGKLTPDYLKNIAANLESLNLSMGCLKDKIKKLLDKSTSYFSAKDKVKYEDLLNSDNVAGLDEFELLHPKLRKIFIEDINIKDTQKIGKIDIYIDISGSMGESCGVQNSKGDHIDKLDFAKSFAAKMKSMDMLNNIYEFDTRVKKVKDTIFDIAMMSSGGGTCIDNVVRKIEQTGVNALIITDAEDCCRIYSDKAFFIGIKGARFHHFEKVVIKEYANKGQAIVFDGIRIFKVDEEGKINY